VIGAAVALPLPPSCLPRRELAERDAADIAVPVELRDIFGDWVVEPEFAVADRLRQQRRLEHFAQQSEVEQRVGGDRPFVGAIGPTVIEEQRLALDAQRHRVAANAIARHDRANVAGDNAFQLPVGAGGRPSDERHDRCHRHKSHGCPVEPESPRCSGVPRPLLRAPAGPQPQKNAESHFFTLSAPHSEVF